jgi:hypothetical protein
VVGIIEVVVRKIRISADNQNPVRMHLPYCGTKSEPGFCSLNIKGFAADCTKRRIRAGHLCLREVYRSGKKKE